MPPRPRPHLCAIVMSHVEPPDSFLPSESMEPPAPAPAKDECWNTGSSQAPHFLVDGPDSRLRHRVAFQPYKQKLQLWLELGCAGKPGGYSPGTQDLHASQPPGSKSAPAQRLAPPPPSGPRVLHLPRVLKPGRCWKPSPNLVPAFSLPLLLSSQVVSSSSVFSFVHLSTVIVVLTHIAQPSSSPLQDSTSQKSDPGPQLGGARRKP